jgi:creatinine amidohydrolase
MGARVAELRWTEVRPLLDAGAVAVLPIGAAAKEHGPHLPLATDWLTAEALGRELARRAGVLVWPALGYGYYPAFTAYPGSTSVRETIFEETLRDLCGDISRAGARHILIANTGVSTIRAIDRVAGETIRAVHVYRGARYSECARELLEQARGGHADEAETSIMLHLHSELVDMSRAPTWTEEVKPGRWDPDDAASPSYSPSGISGDATLATAEKGARLFEAMLLDLEAAI